MPSGQLLARILGRTVTGTFTAVHSLGQPVALVTDPQSGVEIQGLENPMVTSIDPDRIQAGTTGQTLVLHGSGFRNGAVVTTDQGAGLTVRSAAVVDSATVSMTIDATEGAATGQRALSLTNPDGGTTTTAVTVLPAPAPPPPAPLTMSPAQLGAGAGKRLASVRGSGLGKAARVVVTPPGALTLGTPTAVSDGGFDVPLTVGRAAAPGARDLTVLDSAGRTLASCQRCFTVLPPPVVSSLSIPELGRGAVAGRVTVNGHGFQPGATVTVTPSTGITRSAVSVVSPDALTVTLAVAPGATLGGRTVTVTNGSDSGVGSCAGCLTVTPAPTVTSATPGSLPRGSRRVITIKGQGFRPGAQVTVSPGTDLSVGATTVLSATEVSVAVTVGPAAKLGARNLVVTNGIDLGRTTCTSCVSVTSSGG